MDRVWWKQRVRQVWEAFLWALPLIAFICMALFLQLAQALFWVALFSIPVAFLVWIISKGAEVRPSRVLQGICGLLMLRMGIAFGTYLWVHSQEKFVVYTPLEIPASFRHEPIGWCAASGDCSAGLLGSPSVSFYEGESPASQEYQAPKVRYRGSVDRERPECVAILNDVSDIGIRSSNLGEPKCINISRIEKFEARYVIQEKQYIENIGLERFFTEKIAIRDRQNIIAEMAAYEMDAVNVLFGFRSQCGGGSLGPCSIVNWWGIMGDEALNYTCQPFYGSYNTIGSLQFIAIILNEKHDCAERHRQQIAAKNRQDSRNQAENRIEK